MLTFSILNPSTTVNCGIPFIETTAWFQSGLELVNILVCVSSTDKQDTNSSGWCGVLLGQNLLLKERHVFSCLLLKGVIDGDYKMVKHMVPLHIL